MRWMEHNGGKTSGAAATKAAAWINERTESLYQVTPEDREQSKRLAELGNLAAIFAHEVANPLSGLSVSLQFVLSELSRTGVRDSPADDLIRETLAGSLREVDRLVKLLDDFRSATPPPVLILELTDLREMIQELLLVQGRGYRSSGVVVELELEDTLPAVEIDRAKMKQAILNLCKNAVEAMTNGGRLRIAAYRSQQGVAVEISDDGFGLPDDIDVFGLFETTKWGGTGLGLPLVQQVVSAHRGKVSCSSDQGGTTFTVWLPIRPGPTSNRPPSKQRTLRESKSEGVRSAQRTCIACDSAHVRRSRTNFLEATLSLVGIRPFRCQACYSRFWGVGR